MFMLTQILVVVLCLFIPPFILAGFVNMMIKRDSDTQEQHETRQERHLRLTDHWDDIKKKEDL